MAERFGSQVHPSGGQRFGSQTYAAISAAAGQLALAESGADVFAAVAQPSVHGSATLAESAGADVLSANGTSSQLFTMQARESATPDQLNAFGLVVDRSLRFGSQAHPSGGLRFGAQSWAALGPSGPMVAMESGADTANSVGRLFAGPYQFAIYDILGSFVSYSDESLAAAITGTLEDGYKVLLPVSTAGITFTWELNAFGNPSLRLSNLTGTTNLSSVPWHVWDGSSWTSARFDVSDALQGAVFAAESGADTFLAFAVQTILGSAPLVEPGADFSEIVGTVRVSAALAVVESGADVAAISGSLSYTGIIALTESGDDALIVNGGASIAGAMGASEQDWDLFAAAGALESSGSLSASESGSDAFAAIASVHVSGALAATELASADTAAGTGVVRVMGSAVLTELGSDAFSGAALLDRNATLIAIEVAHDVASLAGAVAVSGALSAIDPPDSFECTGRRSAAGDFAAAEFDALEGRVDRFVGRGINGDLSSVADFTAPLAPLSKTLRYVVRSKKQAIAA